MTPTEAEQAEFSGRRGDYWHRRWLRTEGTSVLSDPVVEIRRGVRETDPLVASSVAARQDADVAAIDISGMDLSAVPAVLDWVVEPVETLKLSEGPTYVLEVEVKRDGHPVTIMRHRWTVEPQVAVRP